MRLSPRSFLLLAPFALIGCATAIIPALETQGRAPGTYTEKLKFGGLDRSYLLIVPDAVKDGKPHPVYLALHGVTSNAPQFAAYTEARKYAEKEGAIFVVPNGSGGLSGWNVGWIDLSGSGADDVGYVRTILDKTEGEFKTDKDRVFVYGHSNGAFLANLVAAKLGDRIAAFASVAGTTGLKGGAGIPDPVAPVSALFIHGKADPVVSFDGTVKAMLVGKPAPEVALWWAKENGCDTLKAKATDLADGKVADTLYTGGKRGTVVELIATKNGTHDFPGAPLRGGRESLSGLVAMDEITRFFRAHPRRK